MKSAILANNARYEQEVEHLLSDLGSHDDALLNRKPAKGGWSAMQTMHHLILSEEGSLRYAQKKMNAPLEELGNAGIGSAWRAFLLWVSLTLPIKFKAPKGIDTEFLPENATFAETTARWRAVRAQWRAFFGVPARSLYPQNRLQTPPRRAAELGRADRVFPHPPAPAPQADGKGNISGTGMN